MTTETISAGWLLIIVSALTLLAALACTAILYRNKVLELQVALGRLSLKHKGCDEQITKLADELLDAHRLLWDTETGRGLSDAQAAAHEAHITHALHVVAAGGSVVQFPTQRKASE